MPASKPAGPRPILVGGFVVGLALLGWAYARPSINIMWQGPLGLLLVVSCMGKMVSR